MKAATTNCKTCLSPGCNRPVYAVGQCRPCYVLAQGYIASGKVSHAELVKAGLRLEKTRVCSPSPFTAAVDALKRKAGLPLHHWAGDVTLHRFRVESFGDAAD